jgi:indole-3-glycerol phosphate synthase
MSFLDDMRKKAFARADAMVEHSLPGPSVRGFARALVGNGISIIAEVKYAAPEEGDLGVGDMPEDLACEYERLGAGAVSCLTEPEVFLGSLEYLGRIRRACGLPLLMKDFVVDERQISAGRAMGADAVLLITEMLSVSELERLAAHAGALGMDCLVEVHGRGGLDKALEAGARLIGVNCRDMVTLRVDPRRHEEMAPLIPEGVVKVAESGLTSGGRLRELMDAGYDAVLVGRALASRMTRGEIFRVGEDLRHHQA